jgi:hypothetical protein
MEQRKKLPKRALGMLLALLLVLQSLPSCTHGRPGGIGGSATRYGLKKKVILLPAVDLADAGREAVGRIHSRVFDLLNGAPGLVVQKGEEGLLPPLSPFLPAMIGSMTDEALINAGEDRGVHALVGCILSPVETRTLRKGFWPFRYTVRETEISLLLNVVEIYSGTLAMSLLDGEKVYRPVSEDTEEDKKALAQGLDEAIPAILKRQRGQLLKQLADVRWYAPIRSVDGAALGLSTGLEVGIQPRQTFPVFSRGEEIRIREGRSLLLPGKKIGEIRITEVSETRSTAEAVSGGPFNPGLRVVDAP